ncbi:MAG: hypothetical protein AAB152_11105 [Candidatus Coatesbacteria bacterium]
MKRIAVMVVAGVLAAGCGLLDQVSQMRNFAKCKFRMYGVEQTRLAGVHIEGKTSLKQVSLLDGIKLAAALKSGRLPLQFVLDIEVKNPNAETAGMNRMAWILLIDGREMLRGDLDRHIEIAPNGGVAPLPLEIELDLRQVLSGESRESMLNFAFNVAGEGTHPTHVTLQVKPSILIAGQSVDFPDYITISTEFGGGAGQP